MTKFSAPINPERPRGGPSCAKCSRSCTVKAKARGVYILKCGLGKPTSGPCDEFADASVDRTERGGLKAGYFVARVA